MNFALLQTQIMSAINWVLNALLWIINAFGSAIRWIIHLI